MKRALPEFGAELGECNRLIQVLFNVTTNGLDHRLPRVSIQSLRAATHTFAETGVFRLLRPTEEGHVLATRPPRRA
jgi:hypothetical protein